MSNRKICVVTGTRAEYGLLYWLMKEIQEDPDLELQIVATGMHLSPEFGLTYQLIEQDGFQINEKVEMLLSSDTPVGVAKSIGLGVIGFADAFQRLTPDLLILLGDRFEALSAAQAAMIAKIPIAHIGGGDTTEGAYDEAIRHSITKMSHLHFVTNELSKKRVLQLGENPKYVYEVGSPGIDQIRLTKLLPRDEIEKALNFKFKKKNLLVTFHPATLDAKPASDQFQALLSALDMFGEEVGIIFTKPNADNDGRALIRMIDQYVNYHPNASVYTSLGSLLYLSVMSQVDAVVGNSSSGLYEAPSFKIPTVNIGDRQKGRILASSVINSNVEAKEIKLAIDKALNMDCSQTVNPYGDGHASERIISILKEFSDYAFLLKKQFFEVTSLNE